MAFPYFYPNRPTLIPPDPVNPLNPSPDYINSLDQSGKYIAEKKWNGDNTLIYTDGPNPVLWNRDRSRLCYIPSPEVITELGRLPKGAIFNAETVHKKTKTVKHLLIVHNILAYNNEPLYGWNWGRARKLLESLDCYGDHIQLSQTYPTGFWDLWNQADGEVIEGIILKDPTGILVHSTSRVDDVPWMKKIRKPCKKYNY